MTPRSCPPSAPNPAPFLDPEEELAALAQALSHPARVRILRFLLAQDACFAGDIVDHLPLAQSTVSRHLKVLRLAGLIRGEVDGPHICYCVDLPRLTRVRALLGSLFSESAVPASSRASKSSRASAAPAPPVKQAGAAAWTEATPS